MSRIKFTKSIQICCSQEEAFDLTQNYEKRLRWDSFLKKAELINEAKKPNVGIRAFCVAKNGLGMETEYITFNRPKATAVKMTKGPYLFSSFLSSWLFKTTEPHLTEVTFIYSFKLRFPFNLFRFMIKNRLEANIEERLCELKRALEEKQKDKCFQTSLKEGSESISRESA